MAMDGVKLRSVSLDLHPIDHTSDAVWYRTGSDGRPAHWRGWEEKLKRGEIEEARHTSCIIDQPGGEFHAERERSPVPQMKTAHAWSSLSFSPNKRCVYSWDLGGARGNNGSDTSQLKDFLFASNNTGYCIMALPRTHLACRLPASQRRLTWGGSKWAFKFWIWILNGKAVQETRLMQSERAHGLNLAQFKVETWGELFSF